MLSSKFRCIAPGYCLLEFSARFGGENCGGESVWAVVGIFCALAVNEDYIWLLVRLFRMMIGPELRELVPFDVGYGLDPNRGHLCFSCKCRW